MLKINEKLQHLDEKSRLKLMDAYYSGEKTPTELIELYNIDTTPSNLFRLFPKAKTGDICKYCNGDMYIKRPSKTNYKRNNNIPFCPSCGHKEAVDCNCEGCSAKRETELIERERKRKEDLAKKIELIHKVYNLSDIDNCMMNQLTFLDKLYLSSLCRAVLDEDGRTTIPLDESNYVIAPYSAVYDILKHLYNNIIILVNPNSDINAFKNNEEFPRIFYLDRVSFYINIKYDIEKVKTIREILNPIIDLNENIYEAYEIWREIALYECLDYLIFQMKKVGFNFKIGDKTIAVTKELLDSFSVSQIYSIIYNSVTNATRYYQEGNVSKKQAANSVITRCKSFGEKALMKGWELNKYKRPTELPQSTLSEVLFNNIYKIGNQCIDEVPSIDILKNSIV